VRGIGLAIGDDISSIVVTEPSATASRSMWSTAALGAAWTRRRQGAVVVDGRRGVVAGIAILHALDQTRLT